MTLLGTTGILYYGILWCRYTQCRRTATCYYEHYVVVSDGKIYGVMTTPVVNNGHYDVTEDYITMVWNVVMS